MKTTVIDTFTTRKNLFPVIATALAATYLGYAVIPLIDASRTAAETAEPAATTESVSNPEPISVQEQADFLQISEWRLFGQAVSNSATADGVPPETQLELKLQGIFYLSSNPSNAHAIIELPEQIQKTYKINDQLPGGAILQTIENDKVILLVDNKQESLVLQKTNPEQQPATEDTSLTTQ
ncbi:MAG: type II secretion system protein N [Methylovulum sp.]